MLPHDASADRPFRCSVELGRGLSHVLNIWDGDRHSSSAICSKFSSPSTVEDCIAGASSSVDEFRSSPKISALSPLELAFALFEFHFHLQDAQMEAVERKRLFDTDRRR